MMHLPKVIALCALLVLSAFSAETVADDWPTYQHDNRRSGATKEKLKFPLESSWTFKSSRPPQTAWEGPAKWDAYSTQSDLKSMRNFDPAFYVTAVGDLMYFGSSADDAAHCLNAITGETVWSYYTSAPVRVPPTIDNGKAYFGSDDGKAYCVDAKTGALIWEQKPSTDDRFIPVNGKLISTYPVRTGVLVQDGIAYFGASLLPWRDSFLMAVSADSGHMDGPGLFKTVQKGLAMQGAFLASDDYVYVLQGRSAPIVFNRDEGKRRGVIGGEGGIYALLTEDNSFIAGAPSQKEDRFKETTESGESRDQMASYEGANRIVIDGGIAYLHAKGELSAFKRSEYLEIQAEIIAREPEAERLRREIKLTKRALDKDKENEALKTTLRDAVKAQKIIKDEIDSFIAKLPDCFMWRVECDNVHALIKAGNVLIAGGSDTVVAYDPKTGEQVWDAEVNGVAHGLTVARGQLYVSTDKGYIYCYTGA